MPHDPHRIRGEALRISLYYTLVAWIPGAFWQAATAGTSAVKLGEYLGANDFVFSLLTAGTLIGVLFQIPGSMIADWLGRRKGFFIWTVCIHRLLYIVVGLLPWIFPKARPGQVGAAMLMVVIITISMALNSFGGQGWISWMADLVPPRVRGKYFARRSRLGVAVFASTMLLIAFMLDLFERTWVQEFMDPIARRFGIESGLIFVISIIFIIAGLVGTLDILAFIKVDEPPMKAISREPILERLIKPLYDRAFRRFVLYWSGWTFAVMFNGWVWWVYMLDFLKKEHARPGHAWWADHQFVTATLILTVAFQSGSFLSYPIWGRAVDRFGRKPVLFISSTLHTTNWIFWIFLGPAILPWLLLTQFFGGFAGGGQDIASFNMILQFNRRGGTAYQAVSAVIFGLAGAAGAMLAGFLATQLQPFSRTIGVGAWEHTFNHYAVIISMGVLLKYFADLILLPRVLDAGDRPRSHALRYVIDNTYGSLNTLIFEPIRSGVERTGETLTDIGETLRTGVERTGETLTDIRETLTDKITDAGTEIRRWWK